MINLLPPEEKQFLLLERKKRIVIIIWLLVLFFILYLVLILLPIKIYLQTQIISQRVLLEEIKKGSQQSEVRNLQEKITSINQTLTKLKTFYQEKIYFSAILEKVSKTLPRELYLTNLSIAFSAGKNSPINISLSGLSSTRESLFEFKKNLEKEVDFKDIYFPPANWVKPVNIDFLVNFKMNNK